MPKKRLAIHFVEILGVSERAGLDEQGRGFGANDAGSNSNDAKFCGANDAGDQKVIRPRYPMPDDVAKAKIFPLLNSKDNFADWESIRFQRLSTAIDRFSN
jgi:hypothetical protein